MVKVHSDRFCWRKTEKAGILIVEMKMEDFGATRMVTEKIEHSPLKRQINRQRKKQVKQANKHLSSLHIVIGKYLQLTSIFSLSVSIFWLINVNIKLFS